LAEIVGIENRKLDPDLISGEFSILWQRQIQLLILTSIPCKRDSAFLS